MTRLILFESTHQGQHVGKTRCACKKRVGLWVGKHTRALQSIYMQFTKSKRITSRASSISTHPPLTYLVKVLSVTIFPCSSHPCPWLLPPPSEYTTSQ